MRSVGSQWNQTYTIDLLGRRISGGRESSEVRIREGKWCQGGLQRCEDGKARRLGSQRTSGGGDGLRGFSADWGSALQRPYKAFKAFGGSGN